MRKTRILAIVFSLVLIFTTIQMPQNNVHAGANSGSCGPDMTWEYNESTKVLTIQGTGEMTSHPWIPWLFYDEGESAFDVEKVIIGEGVTSIDAEAFEHCHSLREVVLPKSLKTIWWSVFLDCISLNSINIPENVDSIHESMCRNCPNLSYINVDADNSKYISKNGILYTKDMNELVICPAGMDDDVIIPNGVKMLGKESFWGCNNLTYIQIPKSMSFDNFTYYETPFQECTKLKSTGPIGSGCNIEFGWNEKIPKFAFNSFEYLKTATIPEGIKEIGDNAFGDCRNLEKVILPKSLEVVGDETFECEDLQYDGNTWYTDYGKIRTVGPLGSNSNIEYQWETKIPDSAFGGNDNIENIKLDNSIEELGNSACKDLAGLKSIDLSNQLITIGDECFANCKSLESIDIPSSVEYVGYEAFMCCISLKKIIFPSGIIYDGSRQFDLVEGCEKLEEVNVPNGYIWIGNLGCPNLETVHIPTSLKVMYYSTLNDCSKLKDVYFEGTEEEWNEIKLESVTYDEEEDEWIDKKVGEVEDYLKNVNIHFGSVTDTSNVHRDFYSEKKLFSGDEGYYYKDSYFDNKATVYQQSLATMSLCMAFSTYGSGNYSDYDKNVENIMTQCGFAKNNSYKQYHFNEKPSTHSIGCAIGSKEINGQKVLAVAVRSGGYEAEWASNVTVGSSGNHSGFDEAAETVKDYINSYIIEKGITGDIKIWITGYSRGAATATQTAAKLNDLSGFGYEKNGKNYRVDYDKTSIYAYGFATPAGAVKQNNPHSSSYSNIFNVIDYHDPVPLVAPKKWGFDRYGITKILPYNKSKYVNKLKDKMGEDYYVDGFGNELFSVTNSLGTFCRKLVDSLCDTIGDRNEYIKTYQSEMINAFEISNNVKEYSAGDFVYTVTRLIPRYSLSHPLLWAQLSNNVDLLADVHANQEYYVYQMQMMDKNYSNSLKEEWADKNYRTFKVNCPVNVFVYDSQGDEVASVEYDDAYSDDESGIGACIDENDQKIIYLPVGEEYNIKVVAREDCKVSCGFEEYNTEYGDASRILNFKTISMKEDDELKSSVDAFSDTEIENGAEDGSSVNYNLTKDGDNVGVQSDIKGLENIEDHTYELKVSYDESKGTIYGGGSFVEGSYAKLEAENKPGYDFDGFYVNGNLIENIGSEYDKYSVRLQMNEDTIVEAKFTECNHEWDNGVITIQPTYSSTGVKTYTCEICGETTNVIVPKLKRSQNTSRVTNFVNKKPTSITKIKAKKRALKLTWKKINYVTGYQINYSRSKYFINSKTITLNDVNIGSKKIKKLKRKKRYYFRMRTYITRKRVNYYSAWSKVKSKKTK